MNTSLPYEDDNTLADLLNFQLDAPIDSTTEEAGEGLRLSDKDSKPSLEGNPILQAGIVAGGIARQ